MHFALLFAILVPGAARMVQELSNKAGEVLVLDITLSIDIWKHDSTDQPFIILSLCKQAQAKYVEPMCRKY